MRSAGLALVVAVAAACGPKLIWTGHTPDRLHTIDVVRDGGYDYVVVDGQRRAAYKGVAGWSIAVARDHVAFAAKIGRDWVAIHDDRITPGTWQGIGELRITDDDLLVYVAQRDGGWHVVTDHVAGPRFDAVLAGTLRIVGSHVGYVAQRGAKVHAVVDGRIGPAFDGIGQLALDAEGHFVYAGRTGLAAVVVANGTTGIQCDAVSQLQLGPRGKVAYVATLGDTRHVVIGDRIGPSVDSVSHVVFRDDGEAVAWIGRLDGSDILVLGDTPLGTWAPRRAPKLAFRPTAAGQPGVGLAYVFTGEQGEQVIVDGEVGPRYDEIRTPVWSSDGRLAYAARRGTTWLIVAGDREIEVGDEVGDPVLAGPRLAYAGRRGKTSFVVVDGRTYAFDLVFQDSVTFSADGARWAAIAGDRGREQLFIVVDGTRRVPLAVRELYSAAASGANEATLRDWTRAELAKPPPPPATRGGRR